MPNLELYVDNLQGLRTEVLTSTGVFGFNLELYVDNLQGLRTEVLTSHGGVWVQLGAVC